MSAEILAMASARSMPDPERLRLHEIRVGRLRRDCWRSPAWRAERQARIEAWALGLIGPAVVIAVLGRMGGVW